MHIGLGIFAVIVLFFLNASGGLAPEQFSSTKDDGNQSAEEVSGTSVNQRQINDRKTTIRASNPEVTKETVTDYRVPVVNTLDVRNIESGSALFRAELNMRDYKGGTVYLVYGYDQNQVKTLAKSNQVLDRKTNNHDDRARVTVFDLNPRGEELYEKRINQLVSNADYYYQTCLEYTNLADKEVTICDGVKSFSTNPEVDLRGGFQAPNISVNRANSITDGGASVEVSLRMNDGVDGIPFLVYGLSERLIDEVEDRYSSYSSVREFDDDLQKDRLAVRILGQSTYNVEFDDLEGDSEYFYRACVEYDGERDGLVCSRTGSFETDDKNRSSKPSVTTNGPEVKPGKVILSGNIRMGDFIDGYAFYIYGTNLDKVKEVSSLNSFSRIRQSVDELQKNAVNGDVDGRKSFSFSVTDLQPSQIYHYRMCVQYVDENKYGREEFFINCGEIRSWVSL
jgi:hypothetical protein